ncbi:hypothetical protein BC829DRAFT_227151 [Chytridium lagenaria]|nr:hypothetical protein BC829DRAFT_227151 [Chytridium lagenaria]
MLSLGKRMRKSLESERDHSNVEREAKRSKTEETGGDFSIAGRKRPLEDEKLDIKGAATTDLPQPLPADVSGVKRVKINRTALTGSEIQEAPRSAHSDSNQSAKNWSIPDGPPPSQSSAFTTAAMDNQKTEEKTGVIESADYTNSTALMQPRKELYRS